MRPVLQFHELESFSSLCLQRNKENDVSGNKIQLNIVVGRTEKEGRGGQIGSHDSLRIEE